MNHSRRATARRRPLGWRKPADVVYRLHPQAEEWIKARLAGVTGKPLSHVWRLIEYLCQKHAGPKVDGRSFSLCRRGLASVSALELSEWQARTTIKLLVKTGLVAQISVTGNIYRKTSDGWRKAPIVYRLAAGLTELFRSIRPSHPINKPFTVGDAFGRKANWSKPAVMPSAPILATGKPIADDDPRNGRRFRFDDRLREQAIRSLMRETLELNASPVTPDTRTMAEKIAACPDRPKKHDYFPQLGAAIVW